MALQAKIDLGEISEEDYGILEKAILKRLDEAQKRKEMES
jgi:hypothetical protein